MNAFERQHRKNQLLQIRRNDPLRVVAMYRRVVGLPQHSMLPGGMDLNRLVESILEFEADSGRRTDVAL
jgi:hypothetical protein